MDRIRVQKLKRERQIRDGTANRTVSTGMSPGTRQLLDDIRRLAREGHTPADISARLDVTETGVRNVLALGQEADDTGAHGPVQLPEIEAFRKSWGRSWPGGNGNGNGHALTAGCCSRSRPWTQPRGDHASCATRPSGPCTRCVPRTATSAGTPASPTSPR